MWKRQRPQPQHHNHCPTEINLNLNFYFTAEESHFRLRCSTLTQLNKQNRDAQFLPGFCRQTKEAILQSILYSIFFFLVFCKILTRHDCESENISRTAKEQEAIDGNNVIIVLILQIGTCCLRTDRVWLPRSYKWKAPLHCSKKVKLGIEDKQCWKEQPY